MYGYIYKTTNQINGKIYIGQHKAVEFNPNYKGSGKLLCRAIKQYGKQNFIVQLIEECTDSDQMDTLERFYIKQCNSTDPNIGYNISYGGQLRFFTGQTHTEESKNKMSQKARARTEHKPTTLGRKYINKDGKNLCINVCQLDYYLQQGYVLGKIYVKRAAWNRGLTKEIDERVDKNQEKRRARLATGEPIGCCGLSGDNNKRRLARRAYFDTLDPKEVYTYWYENGKAATQKYYGAYGASYEYLCSICNIVESEEHKHYIRSKSKKLNQSK